MGHEPDSRARPDGKELNPWYVVRSETNQRENNEDSFALFSFRPEFTQPPLFILAIADGMGGHAYGEHVSHEALRKVSLSLFEQLSFERSVNRHSTIEPLDVDMIAKALWSALEQANVHVQRMVQANKWGKAGSTIVVAAILGSAVVVANLGDSPLFHYQAQRRQLIKVTEDHTVAGVLLRAGMITPEMARYHEGRSNLEFFLGSPNLPREAALRRLVLTPGDLVLLCSDGISGVLEPDQIAAILADSKTDLDGMADSLLQMSQEAGETDNQTLILWRYGGPKDGADEILSPAKQSIFQTQRLPDDPLQGNKAEK